MRDQLFKILFSTRLTALLFILYPTAMAFGTFIESWYSTDTAKIWIYNALWFEVIMVFMAINFIGNIFKYRLLRKEKWAVLMIHLSFLLILLGAFVTRYIGYEGMMPIREGASESQFLSEKTYFEAFHCMEKASGAEATPTSPIPEDLASDAIFKKGTAVVITEFCS